MSSTACGPRAARSKKYGSTARRFEPTYRVIGNTKPRGICGSGLIALLSEMFLTGVLDKGGNLNSILMLEEDDDLHL